jgi:hypothetical protein
MARLYTRLADPQFIPSTVGSVYANPSASKTYISGYILFNTNTTSETVRIHNVPNNGAIIGTASDATQMDEVVLTTKTQLIRTFPYPITQIDLNDSIQAVTTTASRVTIQLLGDRDA